MSSHLKDLLVIMSVFGVSSHEKRIIIYICSTAWQLTKRKTLFDKNNFKVSYPAVRGTTWKPKCKMKRFRDLGTEHNIFRSTCMSLSIKAKAQFWKPLKNLETARKRLLGETRKKTIKLSCVNDLRVGTGGNVAWANVTYRWHLKFWSTAPNWGEDVPEAQLFGKRSPASVLHPRVPMEALLSTQFHLEMFWYFIQGIYIPLARKNSGGKNYPLNQSTEFNCAVHNKGIGRTTTIFQPL